MVSTITTARTVELESDGSMKMISIPEYTPLGEYADDHPDELCRFVTELFDANEPTYLTDFDQFMDSAEVRLATEWFNGDESMLCEDDITLYGSTRNFHIAAPFEVSNKHLDKWANWCIRHCGHWALQEEETR